MAHLQDNFVIEKASYTVLGAGRSGRAAAGLLMRHGAKVFVSDHGKVDVSSRALFESLEIRYEEDGHTERALEADGIIVSPGVPSTAPAIMQAVAANIPVLSEVELGFRFCRSPIVAVTGSNGKTTTTS
ncbi:MAG: UDP-N-acetylmuramoyl-L-alanine--D-glutamate ligase, partial [Rhodothermales bacterium]|nr:UDP-N-acetylmuramoyl-L-alanine--D-glutamate ligase [Rhodothermales bacterium]